MLPVIAAAAGASLLGGVLGRIFSSMDKEEADRYLNMAMDEYGNIDVPKLQNLVFSSLGPSALNDISLDPRLDDAEYGALGGLDRIIQGGGTTLEDQANINRVQNQLNKAASARHNAITEEAAQTGHLGAGNTLAMKLAANQEANQRAADMGTDLIAMAQRRSLDALMSKGNRAGEMRAQRYGEASDAARADDLIRRYNADMSYRAQQDNNENATRKYDMDMRKADAVAGMLQKKAGVATGRAQDTQQMYSGLGQGASEAITSYGMYGVRGNPDDWSDPLKKKKE
jgi:hypothetical protein